MRARLFGPRADNWCILQTFTSITAILPNDGAAWCRCKCLAPTHSFLGHNSSMETTLTPPPHLLLLGTRSITIVFWMGPHCERNRKRTRGCLMFLSWWIAYQMPISFHHKGKETKKLHSLSCQIISCFDILILNPCVRSNQCTIGNQSSNYF